MNQNYISPQEELENKNAIKIIRNIFINTTSNRYHDDEDLKVIAEQLKNINFLALQSKNPKTKDYNPFDILTTLSEDKSIGSVLLFPTNNQIEFYKAVEKLKYTTEIRVETINFDELYALSKANNTNRLKNGPQFAFYIANSNHNDSGIELTEDTIIKTYEDFAYDIQYQPAKALLEKEPEEHPELKILHKKLEQLCRYQKHITQIHVFEGWYSHNLKSKQTTIVIELDKKANAQVRNQIAELQKDYISYLTKESKSLNKIETYITPTAANSFLTKYQLNLNTPFIKSH